MLNITEALVAILLLAAVLLISTLEIAFSAANRIALRRFLDGRFARRAKHLISLLEVRTEVLVALSVGVQAVTISTGIFLFVTLTSRNVPYVAGMPGTIGLMIVIVLLLRQLLPRLISTRQPEVVILRLHTIFRFVYALLRPFARLLTSVLNYFHSWEAPNADEDEASEEEIQAFIDAGQEEGILEHNEGELIQSIVEFGGKVAREVMTPRTQIVAAEVGFTADQLATLICTQKHTRIPVFVKELDNLEGVVHERDLIRVLQRGEKLDNLRPLLKPIHFVPETKPVNDLLNEMRKMGEQMVIVVDEYGGVSGLITVEDLVEQIVGEIYDEAEFADRVVDEGSGAFVISGAADLDVLEEKLGMTLLENTESTTVAGAVLEIFGRLPAPGERIEHQGLKIEVLEADRRRIHRLRIRMPAAQQQAAT